MESDSTTQTTKINLHGEIPTRLRHRSRCSESDSGTTADKPAIPSSPLIQPEQVTLKEPKCESDGDRRQDTESKPHNNNNHQSKMPQSKFLTTAPVNREEDKSVFHLLASELKRGYYLEGDESHYDERRERVYTFMQTPRELEKFCLFGSLQCLDAFLFIVTYLPVRIVIALVRLITCPCFAMVCRSQRVLQPSQICDILKGVMVVASCAVLNYIDTSMMYHLIRGQAVIKLYVFYNMLDLFDRLVSGFGQDILDALYWTATEPQGNRRKGNHNGVIFHFIVALVYIIVHTLLILFQATVLNVAFNSHNKALLTIMMSNNFVEIKGSLFKRVDKNNLCQISCGDVKERFHYTVLLLVVFIRNMTEFHWNPDHVWDILPDTVLVLLAEVLVDWIKHAFITKFNEIPAEVYREFSVNLAQDVVTSRRKHAFTDYTDQVSRRLGFTPLPLLCLLVRVCSRSFQVTGVMGAVLVLLFFFCLVSTKLLTSIILLGWGCHMLEWDQQQGCQTDPSEVDSQVIAKKEAKVKSSPSKTPGSKMYENDSSSFSAFSENLFTSTDCDASGLSKDEVTHNNGWGDESIVDKVTVQQCQSMQYTLRPLVPEGTEALTVVAHEDVESEEDSDSLFYTSSDHSTLSSTPIHKSTVSVEYDDEKKYK